MVLLTALLASAAVLRTHSDLPRGWMVKGVAPTTTPVKLSIELKRSEAALEAFQARTLLAADPASPTFRQWADEAAAAPAQMPVPGAVSTVCSWLSSKGLKFEVSGSSIMITTTAAQASSAFGAAWIIAYNNATAQSRVRASSSLQAPAEVTKFVATVYGSHGLPLPPHSRIRPNRVRARDPPTVGPDDLRTLYSITQHKKGSGQLSVRSAVAEFQGQYVDPQDLQDFWQHFEPNEPASEGTLWKVIGDQGSGDGIEALLDVEYMLAIGLGVKTEFWSYQGDDFCHDLNLWTTAMLKDTALQPSAISISYGWQGPLSQLGCEDADIKKVDQNFMLLAGKGVTIVFASGDSGSGYDGTQLWPSWPASSPWVLAVGSTCFKDDVMGNPQIATNQFGSGSGFSTDFNQSAWHIRPITTYLNKATGLPPSGSFPTNGRPTADVSALGEGYAVYIDGGIEPVGGTSASAPTFTAMLALINDALVTANKPQLGYVNQWLYTLGSGSPSFTDITGGTDKIGRGGEQLDQGFDCIAGWDPATGLGTPVFDNLLRAALNK